MHNLKENRAGSTHPPDLKPINCQLDFIMSFYTFLHFPLAKWKIILDTISYLHTFLKNSCNYPDSQEMFIPIGVFYL